MNTCSVGQAAPAHKGPCVGVSRADMRRAGVDPENARLWHVEDGVDEVPTGAFVGIDLTDIELTTRTAGELYMVLLAGKPCLRFLVPNKGCIATATTEPGPYSINPPGSVEIIGRVFWFGRHRWRWQPE